MTELKEKVMRILKEENLSENTWQNIEVVLRNHLKARGVRARISQNDSPEQVKATATRSM